jgi:uncharacterized repeat protein (TIGR01451 family)
VGHSRIRSRSLAAALAVAGMMLGTAVPASADVASLKAACVTKDAADNDTVNGLQLPYKFCDDGVPGTGGTTPNVGAVNAVAVPQKYDGFLGLPDKVAPDPNSGADANGDIALDVDVSLPDPTLNPVPSGGYPLIVMMHGCCAGNKTGWEANTIDAGGEKWHYSNAWFAARGYVVINYTSRGFVNGNNQGSTGETQLDDRRYEINDYQHLAGQLADDSFFNVDPQKVIATGGSYGGGFSWLALTDPTWDSPGDTDMRLAAAAPKYGWSDIVDSLIPNGAHAQDGLPLPATDGSDTSDPLGFPKQSITDGLYASGKTGIPPGTSHATFASVIDSAFLCLQSTDPFESNPLCASTIANALPSFIDDRSAYYQNDFFNGLADESIDPVPVFSASTLTDPLFPPVENRRMVERLKATVSGYPVKEYYGDYQHFVQNKAKEWGDICDSGTGRHVCTLAEYPGGNLNADPTGLQRTGATMRLNRFIDHYVQPPGNPSQAQPDLDVTAALQICPENAGSQPADEPGPTFAEANFAALAPNTLSLELPGTQVTTSVVAGNLHGLLADPVRNSVVSGGRCPVMTSPAGPGVATYTSGPLESTATMIGPTELTVDYNATTSQGLQLNSRLFDVFPNGDAVMVDRGVRRVANANGTLTYQLHGNGWRFEPGHRIRVEIAQDDSPYIKASTIPSTTTISRAHLDIPIRESSVPPPAAADLSIAKSDSPDPVTEGQQLTYTLKAKNEQGDTATNAEIVDQLPGSVQFVSASAGCTESSGTVTCELGDLDESEEQTVDITVTAPSKATQIQNTASISSDVNDPSSGNDSDTEPTQVAPTPGKCDGGTYGQDGEDGDDTLTGTNGPDKIRGLGGDDEIRGRRGADCLNGDEENDELHAGRGTDQLWGFDGDDEFFAGGGGHDGIHCGPGVDTVHAGRNDSVSSSCETVTRGS